MADKSLVLAIAPRFRRTTPLEWSGKLAYATGLAATDGFLTTRSTVGFTSTDRELVETFLRCVDRPVHYKVVEPDKQVGNAALKIRPRKTLYVARCQDRALYEWFLNAGVIPRKSLTLAGLVVPHVLFFDLVRGLLDGDGSVMSLIAAPGGRASPY